MSQGLGRLSTMLPKSETTYGYHFFLDRSEFFCILGKYNSGWDSSEWREVRDVIWKPYKMLDKKAVWHKWFYERHLYVE